MLSEYEQLREARIAQNQQRLKDLGILDDVEQLRALHQPTTTRRLQTSTSRDHQEAHPPAPVRQSARLRRKAGHLLPEDIEEDKENALEADRRREQRALRWVVCTGVVCAMTNVLISCVLFVKYHAHYHMFVHYVSTLVAPFIII